MNYRIHHFNVDEFSSCDEIFDFVFSRFSSSDHDLLKAISIIICSNNSADNSKIIFEVNSLVKKYNLDVERYNNSLDRYCSDEDSDGYELELISDNEPVVMELKGEIKRLFTRMVENVSCEQQIYYNDDDKQILHQYQQKLILENEKFYESIRHF